MIKVALYATTILEQGGGLEKVLIETAEGVSECPGVVADVITMDDRFTHRIASLLSVYYLRSYSLYNESIESIRKRLGKSTYRKCKNIRELRKTLNEYDVVYSKNELLEAAIFKFLVGYRRIPPVIFGCHTPVYYPIVASFRSKLHNYLYNGFVYKSLASGVRKFHVVNDADLGILHQLFPGKEVVKVFMPFRRLRFQHKFGFDWDKSKFNVLWSARMTEQKGVSSLVNIIECVNGAGKDKIVFNILGDGPNMKDIVKLKEKWSNINIFGYVAHECVPSILDQNALFISTSKWECLPYNILEAQAQGIPAIAFSIPGPKNIIEDSITGILVDSEEEFARTILKFADGDESLSKQRIIERTARRFDPKKIDLELRDMFISSRDK